MTPPSANPSLPHPMIDASGPVREALEAGQPVVALESTIISHGMPFPRNVETALSVEAQVRAQGAIPATIAVIAGRPTVGLSTDQIEHLGRKGLDVTKVSRRDLPHCMATGQDGATTVASTMILAARAGIAVFATGGIGGVHRGAERSMDVSADLQELAQTNVAVVCAGAKAILDLPKTLEYLETQGVPVLGFETNDLPGFYTRQTGLSVDYRVDSPAEIAAMMRAKWDFGLDGGVLITNPVPEADAMPRARVDAAVEEALKEADAQGITGKDSTPFLLARVTELTGGDSLQTNIRLVENNARLAALTACEFAKAHA
ncbi:MAG: pseudouridine-5'-phosphate glycosidase [Alphaproteobacteria bacterium]